MPFQIMDFEWLLRSLGNVKSHEYFMVYHAPKKVDLEKRRHEVHRAFDEQRSKVIP